MRFFVLSAAVVLPAASQLTLSFGKVSVDRDTNDSVTSPDALFRESCPEEFSPRLSYQPEILLSSFSEFGERNAEQDIFTKGNVYPSSDSFVRGAIDAWAYHYHLVLRPDEVWFEILTQLNFYMVANAEEIRHLFVDHEGKEEIQVWEFSWKDVVRRFAEAIQERVKTDWLLDWIMPGFSTTKQEDKMTATVLMMGLMQHYFSFSGGVICHLPMVTLMGERKDWVKLYHKLNHLKDWGEEPKGYAKMLEPILEMFVKSWDEPESKQVEEFWQQIVRANKRFTCSPGRPEYDISGWITGFMHWTIEGNLRVYNQSEVVPTEFTTTLKNVTYSAMGLENMPVGYAKAPLKMLDYPQQGKDTQAYLLAGNVGVQRKLDASGEVQEMPMSGWIMYAPVDTADNATVQAPYGSFEEIGGLVKVFGTCDLPSPW